MLIYKQNGKQQLKCMLNSPPLARMSVDQRYLGSHLVEMLASQRSKDSSTAASLACLTQKDSLTAAYLVRRMVVELAKCLQMVDSRIVLAGPVYVKKDINRLGKRYQMHN